MRTREEAPSLREQFKQRQAEQEAPPRAPLIEAADKYLNELADHLVEALKEKREKGDVEEVTLVAAFDRNRWGKKYEKEPAVIFKSEALSQVYPWELTEMSGYARLNEICADPKVDMCLGYPADRIDASTVERSIVNRPSSGIHIFIALPHAVSEDAQAKRMKDPEFMQEALREIAKEINRKSEAKRKGLGRLLHRKHK